MFVVTVRFEVTKDALEDFLPLILENARSSLSEEPGCHRFDVCQSPDAPNEVFLYELYENEAAFEAHRKMPHFEKFSATAEPMIVSKSAQTYRLVDG